MTLDFQLLVDGTDLTDYVVSSERNQSMCNPIGALNIVLAPDLPIAIVPYQDVVFYEQGTKVFTGYSQCDVAARLPVEVSMRCADVLVRAQDTWFTGPKTAAGEPVLSWIQHFLRISGLTNISNDTLEEYPVFPGYGWQYTTAWEAIVSTIQMSPYQIFANRNGAVCVTQIRENVADYTINSYISYERVTNDSWIRNRAVVYGSGFVSDKSETNEHLLPGEVRAAIVATGQIHSPALADSIATKMIQEFRNPLDIKIIEVEGNPNYELGQIVDFTDPETGYNRKNCRITGVASSMTPEGGYITELTLDEKCVSFWGWDEGGELDPALIPGEGVVYTGMTNYGVYRSHSNWRLGPDALWLPYNSGLLGDALTVYDIKTALDGTLWATTEDGLYKREVDSLAWERIALPLPEEWTGGGFPTLAGVCPSTKIAGDVFMLAYGSPDGVDWVWLYHRDGSTWTAYPIGGEPSGGYWEDLTAGGANDDVLVLILSPDGTRLYAAGTFTVIGGVTAAIAYLDETGWHNVCTAANGSINALAWDSFGNLYAGGNFTTIGGVGANYIAKYDGVNWTAMGSGFAWGGWAPVIAAIAVDALDIIYAGGHFDTLGNANRANNIAKFAGGAWSSVGVLGRDNGGGVYHTVWPDPLPCVGGVPGNEEVRGLYTIGVTCYVCGNFEYVNGVVLPQCAGAVYWDGAAWNTMPGLIFPGGFVALAFYRWAYDPITSKIYCVSGEHIYAWDGVGWDAHLPDSAWGGYNYSDIFIDGDYLLHAGEGFRIWHLRDEEWVVEDGTDKDFRCVRPWGELDPYLQRSLAVCGGMDPNGAAYDYITRRVYLDYRAVLFDHYGDTHGLDIDQDGEYVFVILETDLGGWSYLQVMRIKAELSREYGDIEGVHGELGTWAGVLCDPYIDDRVWIFGDLNGGFIFRSDNDGDAGTWNWAADGGWGANEMVAAIIPTISCNADYIAILNDAMEDWKTINAGANWNKVEDTILVANFGRAMPDEVGVVIGTEGLDIFTLQYSPLDGDNWEEQSYELPGGERMANLCWGVEDE